MAENDSKRYYWLKLKKDFFQQHQIKILKSLPNGRLYALIYLELLAESTSHEGELRYSDTIPYELNTLACVIDEDIDNVRCAIDALIKLELVEIEDDKTIFMREIQKLIGSETGSAERKRIYRQKYEGDNVPQLSQNCPQEYRDKSIENRDKNTIELSNDNSMSDKSDYYLDPEYIKNLFNTLCFSYTPITKIDKSSRRYKLYRARLKEYGIDKIKKVFENAEKSDFLKGQSSKNFIADFEWLMRPNNFPKVLEEKYKNRDVISQEERKIEAFEKSNELKERELAHKEKIEETYIKDIELQNKKLENDINKQQNNKTGTERPTGYYSDIVKNNLDLKDT